MLESPCQGLSARPRVDARGEAPATIQSPTHLRFRRSGMHLLRCRPLSQIAGLGLGGLLVAVAMVGCSGDKSTVSPTAGATPTLSPCLLYTSDAADDLLCVDLGGRRI